MVNFKYKKVADTLISVTFRAFALELVGQSLGCKYYRKVKKIYPHNPHSKVLDFSVSNAHSNRILKRQNFLPCFYCLSYFVFHFVIAVEGILNITTGSFAFLVEIICSFRKRFCMVDRLHFDEQGWAALFAIVLLYLTLLLQHCLREQFPLDLNNIFPTMQSNHCSCFRFVHIPTIPQFDYSL